MAPLKLCSISVRAGGLASPLTKIATLLCGVWSVEADNSVGGDC